MSTVSQTKNGYVNLSVVSGNTIRVRLNHENSFDEITGPIRYGIFTVGETNEKYIKKNNQLIFDNDFLLVEYDLLDNLLKITNKDNGHILKANLSQNNTDGFQAVMQAKDDEKYYGLGDTTRDYLQKRGTVADIWVKNVKSYVPSPFILSSKHYGIYSNTTYRQIFDICSKNNDELAIFSEKGQLDLFFFIGNSYSNVLSSYGEFAGKPSLLPQFAYGLTFVCNMEHSVNDVMSDMLNLRREGIPCDVIGLEPKWMSTYYDNTVNKQFDEERFPIPPWAISKENNEQTFFGAIERLGFKLSLWLCCDYDLSYEEERNAVIKKIDNKKKYENDNIRSMDDFELDQNIGHEPILMDKTIVKDEPWFDHLKKFTDYGAKAFKMDGAWQVNEHPDRLYGNGMGDDEMHNLYPLILNKQMATGYENHCGERAMIYSSGGFAGIQQYAATWAGDTGGKEKPLTSMLNHAFSGHSNTSCDMHVFTKEGIHFGFLQTWSQLCNWAYFREPWLLARDLKQIYVDYAKFRYSLIPYLYSASYEAFLHGIPVMRPLPFVYETDNLVDDIKNQYMLGEYLLVSCFSNDIYLPEGTWIDYYTKEKIIGPLSTTLTLPTNKGGGLFIKEGAIIPYWPEMDFVGEKVIDTITLEIYPSAYSEYTLYEDDGISLAYKENVRSETIITCKKEKQITIKVSKRNGSYINMNETRLYDMKIFTNQPKSVLVNNKKAIYTYNNDIVSLTIDCTKFDCEIIID